MEEVAPAQRGVVGADGAEGRGAGDGTQTPGGASRLGMRISPSALSKSTRESARKREDTRRRAGASGRRRLTAGDCLIRPGEPPGTGAGPIDIDPGDGGRAVEHRTGLEHV